MQFMGEVHRLKKIVQTNREFWLEFTLENISGMI